MRTKALLSMLLFVCGLTIHAQETPVQHSELPAQAKTFLKEHFTSPFHHAIKEVQRNRITYKVVLDDNTEIDFTEAGRWVEVDGKGLSIPDTFIQRQIIDYKKINYPKDRIIRFSRNDTGYEMEVSTGTDLKFDARGTFVKIN